MPPPKGTDYLAVIMLGVGGVWARDKTREKAIKNAARIFRTDAGHLYETKRGTKVTVNVIDVTGLNTVSWDNGGFYEGDIETGKRLDRKIERVVHSMT